MTECCVFKNDGEYEKKIDLGDFRIVEVLDYGDRHAHYLYQCRKCGSYVYLKHEEIADFMSFDDYEDYYETLFPVKGVDEAHEIYKEYPFGGFPGGRPFLTRRWSSRVRKSDYWTEHF